MRPCKASSMCLPCRGTESQPRGSEEEGDDKETAASSGSQGSQALLFVFWLPHSCNTDCRQRAGSPWSESAAWLAASLPGCVPCLPQPVVSRLLPVPSLRARELARQRCICLFSGTVSSAYPRLWFHVQSRTHCSILPTAALPPSPPHSINAEPSTEAEGRPSPCPETLPPPPSVVCLTIKCPEEQTPAPRSALHPRASLHPASPSFLHPGPFAFTRARCHLQSRRSTCRPVMIIQSSVAAWPFVPPAWAERDHGPSTSPALDRAGGA